MNKHRKEVYEFNLSFYGNVDWRAVKKHERPQFHPVYVAYCEGQHQSYYRKPRRNPYPAGARHDAWEQGLAGADPMGDHHGRNV